VISVSTGIRYLDNINIVSCWKISADSCLLVLGCNLRGQVPVYRYIVSELSMSLSHLALAWNIRIKNNIDIIPK